MKVVQSVGLEKVVFSFVDCGNPVQAWLHLHNAASVACRSAAFADEHEKVRGKLIAYERRVRGGKVAESRDGWYTESIILHMFS